MSHDTFPTESQMCNSEHSLSGSSQRCLQSHDKNGKNPSMQEFPRCRPGTVLVVCFKTEQTPVVNPDGPPVPPPRHGSRDELAAEEAICWGGVTLHKRRYSTGEALRPAHFTQNRRFHWLKTHKRRYCGRSLDKGAVNQSQLQQIKHIYSAIFVSAMYTRKIRMGAKITPISAFKLSWVNFRYKTSDRIELKSQFNEPVIEERLLM